MIDPSQSDAKGRSHFCSIIIFILIFCLAAILCAGLAQTGLAQNDLAQNGLGEFKVYSSSDGYYSVSLPEGWKIDGFKCAGISAQDQSNPSRGLVYLSRLHEGAYMLPSGTTPESYLKNYLAADFSLGANQVRDIRIEGYEDPGFYKSQDVEALLSSQSSLSAQVSAKAIRCSFLVNDAPTEGSFLVMTRDLYGYGTIIDYLLGFYAPADRFEDEASDLVSAFDSVQLNPSFRNLCIPPVGGSCIECLDSDCCSHECDAEGYCR